MAKEVPQGARFQTCFTLLMLYFKNSFSHINSISTIPLNTYIFGGYSECALVLRRTQVDAKRKSLAPPFGGFLELIKPGPVEEVCIRYSDVNLALANAKQRTGYRSPSTINSLEPTAEDIGITGELVLETTRILARKFKLSRDEIINGLPLIDTSRTNIWNICPAHVKPVPCTVERFRSFTEVCNNILHSSWGATGTPFTRFLPPAYPDGISAIRASITGGPLPPVRIISTFVHPDADFPSNELSILFMSWGQFVDHDLTLGALPRDQRNNIVNCCNIPKNKQHSNCMTIDIPRSDSFYSRYGQTCMNFVRMVAGQRPGCTLGPRVNINLSSSPIDANFVYGSTEEVARSLRLGRGGLLRVWDIFREYGLKPILPPMLDNPDTECLSRPRNLYCFLAGDPRANQQLHLPVLHVLYLREHNNMAVELERLNPHWNDERIYQEVRHIMAASVQHITYKEFVPLLLGEEVVQKYNLTLQPTGYWNGYDPRINVGISIAFQAAAFRFGHSNIQGTIRRYNKFHEFLGEDPLRFLLQQPFMIYEPGKLDELIGGLINTPAQSNDRRITREVTNHLFEDPPDMFGLDLVSLNLMRGRDTGVPSYNDYRQWCGLGRARTFEDLEHVLSNGTAFKYAQIYHHPDDIDLWSGGISERRLPGATIGPTFVCILARQFDNIRRGDRYWYENSGFPSAFTPEQLQEIRKASQAKLICENADDLPTIQPNVMKLAHPIYNPRLPCKELPSIDLRFWQEDPVQGGFHFKK
ncbi:chorion peroxidase-like [Tachypleus tridentatus]|uniref:chorion peroxidase-like n=1 Tax=Tachypleus tridentatus TaxID=6853 RepID=UPI003FD071D1